MILSRHLGWSSAIIVVALALAVVQGTGPSASSLDLFPAFKCPNLLSFLIPNALHCKLCRTAEISGQVSDCSCDFETVDAATHAYFHPLLTQLQTTPFFRFFKVHLDDE